jgi:ATP-dependent RNA helicase CshB
LEKLGIAFQPKVFRDGELVDTYQRDRRIHRHKQQENLDPKLRGLVKKEQKKRKPGYRKKIRRAISQEEQRKRKLERRNRH